MADGPETEHDMADDDKGADTTQGDATDQTGTDNQSADSTQNTRRGDDDRGDRDQARRRARTRSAGQGGDDNDSASDSSADAEPKFTQADLDKQIEKRLERERKRYADYDDVKASASDTKAQMDKLREDLGKALGFKEDDTPPDPAKLAQALNDRDRDIKSKDDAMAAKDEEIAARERTIAARDVELAAWREATKQGLDAATLLDLRSTERNLGTLDFAADDFGASLTALITKAAKDNPALRIVREASPADAGIGTAGSNDVAAAAAPGVARLRAAYGSTTH